jgi:hypothetical protein
LLRYFTEIKQALLRPNPYLINKLSNGQLLFVTFVAFVLLAFQIREVFK